MFAIAFTNPMALAAGLGGIGGRDLPLGQPVLLYRGSFAEADNRANSLLCSIRLTISTLFRVLSNGGQVFQPVIIFGELDYLLADDVVNMLHYRPLLTLQSLESYPLATCVCG